MRRYRNGFSIVELLVVLAVVATLIALLIPAIGKARDYTYATVCMTNQRALYNACYFYADMDRERRYPPMVAPQSVFPAPRITQAGNGVDRWNSSGGVGTNVGGTFNPQANWAEILAYLNLIDPKQLEDRMDTNPVPAYASAAAAATPGVAAYKLSYGINTYLYTFKVDGWGGSAYSAAPTSSNVGGMGDKGYGFYGPKFDDGLKEGVRTPELTLLFGDRTSGDGPGIGYGWFRLTQLDLPRHGTWLPLTFCDGTTRLTSYQSLWGSKWDKGGYQAGADITTVANVDFWYASRQLSPPFQGLNGATLPLGNRGTWPGPNYTQINPGYKSNQPGTPGFFIHSTVMPYWQGWEKQPFAPGL